MVKGLGSLSDNVKYLEERRFSRVLIASHRGKFGGSIIENTTPAFDVALGQGADLVEMDVRRTADGELVLFHDDTVSGMMRKFGAVEELDFEEIKCLNLKNYIRDYCGQTIETLDRALAHLKGRCLLNLDKCWDCWGDVDAVVSRHGMRGQVLLKAPVKTPRIPDWINGHTGYFFMPILFDDGELGLLRELHSQTGFKFVEVITDKADSYIFSEEFIQEMHALGVHVWINALTLNAAHSISAGYDDNRSLIYGRDQGWGKLVDMGFDIIQTDWPHELGQYLTARGKR